MKRLVFTLSLLCFAVALWAQRSISGRITDQANGEALIGATIAVKGTTTGTITNATGDFTITVPNTGAVLMVSYTGYKTTEVSADGLSRLDISLGPNDQLIDEVVVIGYGKQIKSTLTGNIARVNGESIQSMPVVSFEQGLQGQAAGVYVESVNGKLGGAMRMRVRGVGSINADTEPLVVVDGIPLTKDFQNTSGAPLNPLADFNFNDVASIEVLKDASAKAIYGSRGSNGVILITTKSGRAGRSRIELDVQTGFSRPTGNREFLNAAEFIELFTEAANNTDDIEGYAYDDPDSWTEFVYSRFRRYDGYTNWEDRIDQTDWQDQALRTGSLSNATLAFSGGNENMRYYASANYGNTEGILVANNLEKMGGRLNLDFDATERFKVGVNLNLARTFTDQLSDDNAFSTPMQLVALAPITPVRDENGILYDRPVTTYYNGLIDVEDGFRHVKTLRTLATAYGDYRFTDHLNLRLEGATNIYTLNDDAFFGDRTDNGNDSHGYGFSAWNQNNDYNLNAVLHWGRSFNERHNLGIDLGSEYYDSRTVYTLVEGEQFPSDEFKTLASAALITNGTSTVTQYNILSYFGRASYDFERRYLFNVSARVDGSSRFGKNERYAFFPAVSLGWVLSEEGFLRDNHTLSFLKIRGSWGQSGNAGIGNFASLGLYQAGAYNDNSALTPEQIPNPNLTWEKARNGILASISACSTTVLRENLTCTKRIPPTCCWQCPCPPPPASSPKPRTWANCKTGAWNWCSIRTTLSENSPGPPPSTSLPIKTK